MRRRIPVILTATGCLVATLSACDMQRGAALTKIAEGVQLLNANDAQRAITAFEDAISLDNSIAEAHYYIGLTRLQRFHDPSGSLMYLENAVAADPDDPTILPEMHYQLGVAFEDTDRISDAQSAYRQVIEVDPQHSRALFRLGQIVEDDGEIRDAIDFYMRSIYADARFPWAYNALGNIYLRYGRPQEAIQVFENGIQNNPDNMQNRADIARVYVMLENYDLAINYLTQALEEGSGSSAMQYNLGVAYRARFVARGQDSDRTEAIGYLQRAASGCNPSEEQARCDSIAGALRELDPPPEPPTP